jgi:hypothetical protein
MTAKGKINASNVQVNDRIIVRTDRGGAYPRIEGDSIRPSQTKTGEGVVIARVVAKFKVSGARGYLIKTTAGGFYAEPIQTMWLAPEDAAGIKRAHVEALAEDNSRAVAEAEVELEKVAQEIQDADEALVIGTQQFQRLTEIHRAAASCARRSYGRESLGRLALSHLADIRAELAKALTLHSQDGKVISNSKEGQPKGDEMTATTETINLEELPDPDGSNTLPIPAGPWSDAPIEAPALTAQGADTEIMDKALAKVRETTGSAVVRLLEKVWARIREDHPELPDVVIVTGSGHIIGGLKWGHFRAGGWSVRAEGEGATTSTSMNEMFMAGETLAKGAKQTLQTMLHEAGHLLGHIRDIKNTSRQGRWHNKAFLKLAEEMGLEYRAAQADKTIGYSAVVLTDETIERYADLLAELDREIHLVVGLPGWLGGDDDDETTGGENVRGVWGPPTPRPPRGPPGPSRLPCGPHGGHRLSEVRRGAGGLQRQLLL